MNVKLTRRLAIAQLRQRKIQGILYDVLDDEIAIEDDEDGDTKIDRNGVLLGGEHEYR